MCPALMREAVCVPPSSLGWVDHTCLLTPGCSAFGGSETQVTLPWATISLGPSGPVPSPLPWPSWAGTSHLADLPGGRGHQGCTHAPASWTGGRPPCHLTWVRPLRH